jgi:DNA adenine methylase
MLMKVQPHDVRPILKWAGGKYQSLDFIRTNLAAGRRLVEPFAGSAVVSLNINFETYLINDVNPDLIGLYTVLMNQKNKFITKAKGLFSGSYNDESHYYKLRERFNRSNDKILRAILFIYLNRHSYNGLCRYNSKHEFNVPFGRYKGPSFPNSEVEFFIEHLQNAKFTCGSYTDVFNKLKRGDVVYADPPYLPANTKVSTFTAYSSDAFSMDHHVDLASRAKFASKKKGIFVAISNHDSPGIRKIYKGAVIKTTEIRRYISCNGSKREKVGELLAIYAP